MIRTNVNMIQAKNQYTSEYLLVRDGERIDIFGAKLVAAMSSGHHHLGVLGERESQKPESVARLLLVIIDGDLKVAHGAANTRGKTE